MNLNGRSFKSKTKGKIWETDTIRFTVLVFIMQDFRVLSTLLVKLTIQCYNKYIQIAGKTDWFLLV